MNNKDKVLVGKFGSPIGLNGGIKVNIMTSTFEVFKKLKIYTNFEETIYWNFSKITFLQSVSFIFGQNEPKRAKIEKATLEKSCFTKSLIFFYCISYSKRKITKFSNFKNRSRPPRKIQYGALKTFNYLFNTRRVITINEFVFLKLKFFLVSKS